MGNTTRPKRALVLINPTSRRGREAKTEALDALRKMGVDMIEPSEKNPGLYCDLIYRFKDQIDRVILGGGDGTLSCSLKALQDTELPMGIIPLGTANNFARNLGIPLSIEESVSVIAEGNTRLIDVGLVNGLPFLNVAGIGLSTRINRTVPHQLKKKWGVLAYAFSGFKLAKQARPFSALIRCDNRRIKVRTLQITVCNGKHYGAGMTISPDATIADQLLDLSSTEVKNWWNGLRVLKAMKKGDVKNTAGIRLMRGKEIVILTRHPVSIDVDGELLARTPAHFQIKPNALAVYAPLEKEQVA